MTGKTLAVGAAVGLGLAAALATAATQRDDAFGESRDHPAIAYTATAPDDAVARLNRRLASGDVTLRFDPRHGYLGSVLEALGVPVSSQVLVYSQTSFQAPLITFEQPRALFFTDEVAVGWVPPGEVLEVSALDPRQGTIYYELRQTPEAAPRFTRNDRCLACHISWDTRAVPGPLVQTAFPRRHDREYANGFVVDHRVPLDERWGGWFVTGRRTPPAHVGNQALIQPALTGRASRPRALTVVEGLPEGAGYLAGTSDVVALMVLDHQAHLTNLLTRAGWEARVAVHDGWLAANASTATLPPRVQQAVDELADYMLFVDEAPIAGRIEGGSGFAEWFSAQGPRDAKGRSLRDLQLEGRLMRHPLSYMIYTAAFDALPPVVKQAVYRRLGAVLAGDDAAPKYRHLTPAVRQAVREILRETKPDLPADLR
ncbi:MAG: hypothetical protein Q8L86_19690 [Vicinamibacterales bacterium]|nr:hypothetical protein [Vicinamibacterales bacterium]